MVIGPAAPHLTVIHQKLKRKHDAEPLRNRMEPRSHCSSILENIFSGDVQPAGFNHFQGNRCINTPFLCARLARRRHHPDRRDFTAESDPF